MPKMHKKRNLPSSTAADGNATAKATAVQGAVRTPWGAFAPTVDDYEARDPFEPEAPVSPDQANRLHAGRSSPAGSIGPGNPAPLSPRELFELLMSPAAHPSRSSPVRNVSPTPAPVEAADADADAQSTIPAQADLVLSALEAGQKGGPVRDRRGSNRRSYRVKASLRLFSDSPAAAPWVIYTRDIHPRGLGFITPHRLPLGYGGIIQLPDPDGGDSLIEIHCTLLRCREAAPGWFEGSLYFNREQIRFGRG